MDEPIPHPPVLLLLAAFSRHDDALDWARQRAIETWGPLQRESPRFAFVETSYYDATMGPGLKKVFFTFQWPFDPEQLVEAKLLTNRWEEEYAALARNRACSDLSDLSTKGDSPIFADTKIGTVPSALRSRTGEEQQGVMPLAIDCRRCAAKTVPFRPLTALPS